MDAALSLVTIPSEMGPLIDLASSDLHGDPDGQAFAGATKVPATHIGYQGLLSRTDGLVKALKKTLATSAT